jgi:CheY-like chemotaxis protein
VMSLATQPILLVEDEENDVMLLQRAFRRSGMLNPLQVVRHGDDAVAYLEGTGEYADRAKYPLPVLVLLDLKLPRRTGLEVLEWVKERAGVRKIPIVVLTSSKNDTDVDRAYELGANSYLVKPVSFETLLELVKSLELYWLVLNERPNVSS